MLPGPESVCAGLWLPLLTQTKSGQGELLAPGSGVLDSPACVFSGAATPTVNA